MKNILFFALVVSFFLFESCGDDTVVKAQYRDGIIVVNQGAFLSGTGSLTYKERNVDSIPVNNIFSNNNDGIFLGNVAQSMIEHDDKNFISINNGGKVVVTNKNDFTLIDTISNINLGRYFASNGDKLYLSAWGASGSDGGVFEIDAKNNVISSYTELGNGPEGLLFVDDLLYIAKGGGFGLDSLVLIMDTDDNSIINSLIVGDNPELMVKDNDDNVYVICSGYTDWNNPDNNSQGKLVKISNQEIVWSISIPNGSNRLAIDAENDFIYFNANGSVVKHDLNSVELNTTVIKDVVGYALAFDEEDKRLYIGDAKDYSSQGEVYVFSTDDEEVESFSCGVIPSYFHFQ